MKQGRGLVPTRLSGNKKRRRQLKRGKKKETGLLMWELHGEIGILRGCSMSLLQFYSKSRTGAQ